MKKTLFVSFLFLISIQIFAGDELPSQKTSTASGRYEIIQANALRFTFRLDKYTGDVYSLIEPYSSSGSYRWKRVLMIGSDYEELENKNTINYQMFMSGITFRYTFLTNIHSGKSWVLYEDPNEGYFFAPIDEPLFKDRVQTHSQGDGFRDDEMRAIENNSSHSPMTPVPNIHF
jgi:hypothetical protein